MSKHDIPLGPKDLVWLNSLRLSFTRPKVGSPNISPIHIRAHHSYRSQLLEGCPTPPSHFRAFRCLTAKIISFVYSIVYISEDAFGSLETSSLGNGCHALLAASNKVNLQNDHEGLVIQSTASCLSPTVPLLRHACWILLKKECIKQHLGLGVLRCPLL